MKIILDHVTKRYDQVTAVDNLTLDLPVGRTIALVGPNGAGKSTLLRLMAGREIPDEGDIIYDGISICDYPEKLAGVIGLMPDTLPDSNLWTVEPYLDYFARANNLKGEERRSKVAEVIDFMKIEPLKRRRLSELSKGLKQRVSLARVLLGDPQVLLLDEPAAGLDPRARAELRDDICHLASQGKAIVISSHILLELEDMCSDVIIMECGHLCASGGIQSLKTGGTEKSLMLKFGEVTEKIENALRGLPNFNGFSRIGRGTLKVAIHGGQVQVDEFMVSLFNAHLPLREYSCEGRNLETIFLEKTEDSIQ